MCPFIITIESRKKKFTSPAHIYISYQLKYCKFILCCMYNTDVTKKKLTIIDKITIILFHVTNVVDFL